MGLLPNIGIDVVATVREFKTLLTNLDRKLAKMLEIEERREDRERKAGTGAADRALGVRLPYRTVLADGTETYPQAQAARGGAGGGTTASGAGMSTFSGPGTGGCGCNPKAAQ